MQLFSLYYQLAINETKVVFNGSQRNLHHMLIIHDQELFTTIKEQRDKNRSSPANLQEFIVFLVWKLSQ